MSDCECHSKDRVRPIGGIDFGQIFADTVAPIEGVLALQDQLSPRPVTPDPRLVAFFVRGAGGDGRVGLEPVTTAAVAAAVASVVARYGPGIVAALWKGLEDLLGINTCSAANKKKHRARINVLLSKGMEGIEEVSRGIQEGRMTGATGKCLEYALPYAAKRVVAIAREMGLPVDDIDAINAIIEGEAKPKLPEKDPGKRCIFGRDPVTLECYPDREAARAAHNGERVRESSRCTAPPEALLLGIDSARFCAMTPAQQNILVEQVRAASLNAAERAALEALPFNLRRDHFLTIAKARVEAQGGAGGAGFQSASGAAEGGSGWIWAGLLVLVGGAAYIALRNDDDEGSR